MSFMLVKALRVECPKCGSIRLITIKSGPVRLQVGDMNCWSQQDLARMHGTVGQNLFHIQASCELCVAPLLTSSPHGLAIEVGHLLGEIEAWVSLLQQASIELLTLQLLSPTNSADQGAWLEEAFPECFRECLLDPRCGLYSDYFTKMKKRFKTQTGRSIERDGVPLNRGFREWLRNKLSGHPFNESLEALRRRINTMAQEIPGPWRLVKQADSWLGINLNPHICCEQSLFIADGMPGTPLYFVYEANPKDLLSVCEAALRQPASDPADFARSQSVELALREKVSTTVELLRWPLTPEPEKTYP